MWKPSSVVPQHRTRAILVWVAILVTAFAYTVWQTAVVIRKRANPSTKLMVSNQRYQFPTVSVCLEDGYGCGYNDHGTDACISSSLWTSHAWYEGGDEFIYIEAQQVQDLDCIEFDLTQIQVPEGERETAQGVTASIEMDWVSSDNATAETEYSAGVYVILDDGSGGSLFEAESLLIPYSRNEIASDDRNYDVTAMTIGKTKRNYLSGTSITNYPVLTLATTKFVTTPDWDLFSASSASPDSSYWYTSLSGWEVTNSSAVGTLFLEITQGSYSHTQVEDIEPLEIGALFGNVGGFWELLVLAWGVFFITRSRDTEPTLKARNFAKTLKRGGSLKRKRPKIDSAAAEESGRDGPRPPDWDSSDEDDRHASGPHDWGAIDKAEKSRRRSRPRSAGPRRPVALPLPRRSCFHSEPGNLGISTSTSSTLAPSRRSSASVVEGTVSAVPSTASMRRWSGSNAAIAASTFNTYDAAVAQTSKAVFTVNGGTSSGFSSNPAGDKHGKGRTSFFISPPASAHRIHPESDDESSRSAGEEADESDLELGCGSEAEWRYGKG
eukprot:g2961.t1